MERNKEGKKTVKFFAAAAFLVCAAVAFWFFTREEQVAVNNTTDNLPDGIEEKAIPVVSDDDVRKQAAKDYISVTIDSAARRVFLPSGAIGDGDDLEYGRFSKFSGFESLEKDASIVTGDALEHVGVVLASGQNGSDQEYICDGMKKICEKTDILTKKYEGIKQLENGKSIIWSDWDSNSKTLWGSINDPEKGDIAPIYVCDTQKSKCEKIESEGSNIPNGAISPSHKHFAFVKQNDEPNIRTGDKWELSLYSKNDFSKPLKTYNISSAIDRDEAIAYDSVKSIAWYDGDRKLVFATARNIFSLDASNGDVRKIYAMESASEDDDVYWDEGFIRMSADGNSVVFAGYSVDAVANDEVDDETADMLMVVDVNSGEGREFLKAKEVELLP